MILENISGHFNELYVTRVSQYLVVNGSMSRWRSMTSAVPEGSVLGPVLYDTFTNGVDSRSTVPSESLQMTPS